MTDAVPALPVEFTQISGEVTLPVITVQGLPELKAQAEELAQYLETLEPDEKSLAETKNMLSKVRKITSGIAKERKAIKGQILQPFEDLERDFQEIEEIIKKAESIQRVKVKAFDEQRIEVKLQEIGELFDKHAALYDLDDVIDASQFITPKHLTKSCKMSKIEDEIVQFMIKTKTDIDTINRMDDSNGILVDYFANGFDITKAIASNQVKQAQLQAIRERMVKQEPVPTPEPKPKGEIYTITTTDKDAYLALLDFAEEYGYDVDCSH